MEKGSWLKLVSGCLVGCVMVMVVVMDGAKHLLVGAGCEGMIVGGAGCLVG